MAAKEMIMVEPGAGSPVSALGFKTVIKIRGEQTSGAFSIVENMLPPGAFVPPHRHERIDEVSYLLEGELGAMVAEEYFQLRPGSFVVRPKGVPHALWVTGTRPARFLDIFTPAGHEAFFEEVARIASLSPPTAKQLAEAGLQHDVIFMPELAPPLVKKYNLRMPG